MRLLDVIDNILLEATDTEEKVVALDTEGLTPLTDADEKKAEDEAEDELAKEAAKEDKRIKRNIRQRKWRNKKREEAYKKTISDAKAKKYKHAWYEKNKEKRRVGNNQAFATAYAYHYVLASVPAHAERMLSTTKNEFLQNAQQSSAQMKDVNALIPYLKSMTTVIEDYNDQADKDYKKEYKLALKKAKGVTADVPAIHNKTIRKTGDNLTANAKNGGFRFTMVYDGIMFDELTTMYENELVDKIEELLSPDNDWFKDKYTSIYKAKLEEMDEANKPKTKKDDKDNKEPSATTIEDLIKASIKKVTATEEEKNKIQISNYTDFLAKKMDANMEDDKSASGNVKKSAYSHIATSFLDTRQKLRKAESKTDTLEKNIRTAQSYYSNIMNDPKSTITTKKSASNKLISQHNHLVKNKTTIDLWTTKLEMVSNIIDEQDGWVIPESLSLRLRDII